MIQKISAYKSSDGTAHSTLEEAQTHEILAILQSQMEDETSREVVASVIMANQDKFIDILTMKPNSLPKARKINGGTKKRTPKHIAAQTTLPLDTTEPPRAA